MSLKYRIVYDTYSRYEKKKKNSKIPRILFTLVLCLLFILFLAYSPNSTRVYKLILPGDPAVTTNAFCELSKAMDRGEPLSAALDVFCETIMDAR